MITVSLQQDSQYLDIDYEDVELKIAMPSYENVNYNNSTKNVSMLGTNYVSKGVSDLETCMDYFALPGRSCEILNFCLTAQTA